MKVPSGKLIRYNFKVRIIAKTRNLLLITKAMIMRSFNMVIFVSLAITNWTQGQASGVMVSVQMKKRASFDGNLNLTSKCYISEIENTSPLYCASRCLIRPDVCHGILFNRESGACKLMKCNPVSAFSEGQFYNGKWDLLWKENGIQ